MSSLSQFSFSERNAFFWTGTKVVKTPHSIKDITSTKTETINFEAVILLLSNSFLYVFTFTTSSYTLKQQHGHVLNATGPAVPFPCGIYLFASTPISQCGCSLVGTG